MKVLILYFASLIDVLFFAVLPSKVYFSGCQFQNSTYSKSHETHKSFKFISLSNLRPRTKELCWRLLDSRLHAKTAYYYCKWRTALKPGFHMIVTVKNNGQHKTETMFMIFFDTKHRYIDISGFTRGNPDLICIVSGYFIFMFRILPKVIFWV